MTGLLWIEPLALRRPPSIFGPDPGCLALYGACFGFGIVLFAARDQLDDFRRGAWLQVAAGLIALVLYKLAVDQWLKDSPDSATWKATVALTDALMIWFLFFGLTGVTLRYLERPIPVVRYVADASYWCYLIHFPVIIWIPGFLASYGWSPEVKFAVLVILVSAISFVTYDLFVRWSYIGTILQGRRYPSALRSLFPRALDLEKAPELPPA
jgi:peptidoglycan/LPS O-acetylase OafA/YrhL